MKFTSSFALGFALATAAVAVPAIAKDKAPAVAQPKLSKEFVTLAQPIQAAIKAKTYPDAAGRLAALDAVAKSPDEQYYAALFRYQTASGMNDKASQARAAEALMAASATPPEVRSQLVAQAGTDAYFAKNYALATQRLSEADRAGTIKAPDVYLVLADSYFKQNQFATGEPFAEKAIALQKAAGTAVPNEWYLRIAGAALASKNQAATSKWMRAMVAAAPTPENWRSALISYRDSGTRDAGMNLDIFRLLRDTKSLAGERDYFEYAATAQDKGVPGEAKSVLDEGFATNQFSTGARALNELRATNAAKIAADRASLAASERAAAVAATGKTALATGDAYLGYGDNAKAAALYRLALSKGGIDAATANTHLGIALARSGQKAEARTAFQAVTGPRAEIAAFWLQFLGA